MSILSQMYSEQFSGFRLVESRHMTIPREIVTKKTRKWKKRRIVRTFTTTPNPNVMIDWRTRTIIGHPKAIATLRATIDDANARRSKATIEPMTEMSPFSARDFDRLLETLKK